MEIVLLFGVFFVLLVLGVPVAVAMLAASIVDILVVGFPWIIAPERMINSINSFPLLAIPFFIFAGVVMNQGGSDPPPGGCVAGLGSGIAAEARPK